MSRPEITPISKLKKYKDFKSSGTQLITSKDEPVALVLSFGEATPEEKKRISHWLQRNPKKGIELLQDHLDGIQQRENGEESE